MLALNKRKKEQEPTFMMPTDEIKEEKEIEK
jgi:hypothetical protein